MNFNQLNEESRERMKLLAVSTTVSLDFGMSDIMRNKELYSELEAEGLVTVNDKFEQASGGLLPPSKEIGLYVTPTSKALHMIETTPELVVLTIQTPRKEELRQLYVSKGKDDKLSLYTLYFEAGATTHSYIRFGQKAYAVEVIPEYSFPFIFLNRALPDTYLPKAIYPVMTPAVQEYFSATKVS